MGKNDNLEDLDETAKALAVLAQELELDSVSTELAEGDNDEEDNEEEEDVIDDNDDGLDDNHKGMSEEDAAQLDESLVLRMRIVISTYIGILSIAVTTLQ